LGSIPYGPNSEVDISKFVKGYDENEPEMDEDLEGLAIEVLERERREWRLERIRLMQCIHHQQIELGQRAAASHERATEIAKVILLLSLPYFKNKLSLNLCFVRYDML
jgi:hypothetical protein